MVDLYRYRVTLLLVVLYGLLTACGNRENKKTSHYFLRGYDHLEFRDQNGSVRLPQHYIRAFTDNDVVVYVISDSTLTLFDTKKNENYTGYIRTFHWRGNNLQGEFKDGKMYRLRYWDGRRRLRMDADYLNKTGVIWFADGKESIRWNENERYSYYRNGSGIRSLVNDSAGFYYDTEGEMTHYEVRTDTTFTRYYPDGHPSYYMESRNTGRGGVTKSWHENGQLKMIGQYKNGRGTGTWIEYDSLGREVAREEYD